MKDKTKIKYFQKQFKDDYPKAKFCIGDGVRIKQNAQQHQTGKYKNWEDDEDWSYGVIVSYTDTFKKLKGKVLTVIGISEFPFITPKSKTCRHYKLSDGTRTHYIFENELIKVKK